MQHIMIDLGTGNNNKVSALLLSGVPSVNSTLLCVAALILVAA